MTTRTAPAAGNGAPAATETYAVSYARLAAIAERLRAAAATVSVDTLVEDVRAARAAPGACGARPGPALPATAAEEVAAETAEAGQPGRG